VYVNLCLPDRQTHALSTFHVQESGISFVETVAITVNIKHNLIGDIRIRLTSPSGTSVLVANETFNTHVDLLNYTFYIRSFYGESGNGNWSLNITDAVINAIDGHLKSWSLQIWGTGNGCSASFPCSSPPRFTDDQAWGLCRSDLVLDLSVDLAIPIAVGATALLVSVWCCVKCRRAHLKRGEKEKLLNKTPQKRKRYRGRTNAINASSPSSSALIPASPSVHHGIDSTGEGYIQDSPNSKITASPSASPSH